MEDIRKKVSNDGSVVKTLQRIIPGFHGYREREDLRDADKIVRTYLVKELDISKSALDETREILAENTDLENIEQVQKSINQFDTLREKILHAESGYAGYNAPITVKEKDLKRIYDYDASLIEVCDKIKKNTRILADSAAKENFSKKDMLLVIENLKEFSEKIKERWKIIFNL